jgi:hypothetical protein
LHSNYCSIAARRGRELWLLVFRAEREARSRSERTVRRARPMRRQEATQNDVRPQGVGPVSSRRVANAATPAEVGANAAMRAEELRAHLETLNAELARLKAEMVSKPRGTPARMRYRNRAKQVMAQKKDMEKRVESALNLSYSMTVVDDIQASQRQALMFQSIRNELGMPPDHGPSGDHYSPNDLGDVVQQSNNMAAILGAPLDGEFDESELEAELDRELEDEYGNRDALPTSAVDSSTDALLNDAFSNVRAVQGYHGRTGPVPSATTRSESHPFSSQTPSDSQQ